MTEETLQLAEGSKCGGNEELADAVAAGYSFPSCLAAFTAQVQGPDFYSSFLLELWHPHCQSSLRYLLRTPSDVQNVTLQPDPAPYQSVVDSVLRRYRLAYDDCFALVARVQYRA